MVTKNFPLDTDGVLGRDFLEKHYCKKDYKTYTLNIYIQEQHITLPIKSSIPNIITLPHWSESMYPIENKEGEDRIILNDQLKQGIYRALTMIPAKESCYSRILNTTNKKVTLKIQI